MRNILSLTHGEWLSGREIKDWITFQIENKTSHMKEATKMRLYLDTLQDDRLYSVFRGDYQSSKDRFVAVCRSRNPVNSDEMSYEDYENWKTDHGE